jgi:diguanylate cyclase (GGDEF)-like protein
MSAAGRPLKLLGLTPKTVSEQLPSRYFEVAGGARSDRPACAAHVAQRWFAELLPGERGPFERRLQNHMSGLSGTAAERSASSARRIATLCGAFTALVGAVVLIVGWVFDVTVVRSVVPGTVGMKASTSLMFVLCGAALLLVPRDGNRRRIGRMCAAATVLLALAFLSEYALGWKLGIDEVPFRDAAGRATDTAYPGRPAPTGLVCFVLAGVALCILHSRWRIEEVLMLPVLAVASMCLIGYAYEIPAFYGPASASKMALNTGVVFLVLAGGVMFAAPHGRSRRILGTSDPGTVMARRLLPLAVLVPLTLGWLRLLVQDAGIFGLRVGTWLLTMTTITCLVAVIVLAASSLSRTDGHRRRLERELKRLADEDELTGLPNRRGFEERLRRELALASRHHAPGALLMIDLDRFKAINDDHGHAAGDDLLQGVGKALQGRLRDTDALGRLGGDEFVAYLPQTDAGAAGGVAANLLAVIREASTALGDGMHTTASVGVAFDSASSLDPAEMLKAADAAMYRAKRAGGNRVDGGRPPAPFPCSRTQLRAAGGTPPVRISAGAVPDREI